MMSLVCALLRLSSCLHQVTAMLLLCATETKGKMLRLYSTAYSMMARHTRTMDACIHARGVACVGT
jgi:hypothetical protein